MERPRPAPTDLNGTHPGGYDQHGLPIHGFPSATTAHHPAVDGTWLDTDKAEVYVISGSSMSCSNGDTLSLQRDSDGRLSTECGGSVYHAQSDGEGRLNWDFGVSWVRPEGVENTEGAILLPPCSAVTLSPRNGAGHQFSNHKTGAAWSLMDDELATSGLRNGKDVHDMSDGDCRNETAHKSSIEGTYSAMWSPRQTPVDAQKIRAEMLKAAEQRRAAESARPAEESAAHGPPLSPRSAAVHDMSRGDQSDVAKAAPQSSIEGTYSAMWSPRQAPPSRSTSPRVQANAIRRDPATNLEAAELRRASDGGTRPSGSGDVTPTKRSSPRQGVPPLALLASGAMRAPPKPQEPEPAPATGPTVTKVFNFPGGSIERRVPADVAKAAEEREEREAATAARDPQRGGTEGAGGSALRQSSTEAEQKSPQPASAISRRAPKPSDTETLLSASAAGDAEAPLPYPVHWMVCLDRSTGGELGIAITALRRVELVKPGGLVDAWNRANPSSSICPGDRIHEVNGLQDLRLIVEEMMRKKPLEITVARGAWLMPQQDDDNVEDKTPLRGLRPHDPLESKSERRCGVTDLCPVS